jgi:hypothetical protein
MGVKDFPLESWLLFPRFSIEKLCLRGGSFPKTRVLLKKRATKYWILFVDLTKNFHHNTT